jgi:hypothetical protein
MPALPDVAARSALLQRRLMTSTKVIVDWLGTNPGDGWQQRWEFANPDRSDQR